MKAEIFITQASDGYLYTLHCKDKLTTGTVKTLREVMQTCEEIIERAKTRRCLECGSILDGDEGQSICKGPDKDSQRGESL